jgi:preprotein translocase subunit SecE
VTETHGGITAPERPVPRPKPDVGGRGARRGGFLRRLGLYYRQVVAELRKVIWPTRRELITYTTVALVFVSVMVAIIAALDIGFAKAVLQIFG